MEAKRDADIGARKYLTGATTIEHVMTSDPVVATLAGHAIAVGVEFERLAGFGHRTYRHGARAVKGRCLSLHRVPTTSTRRPLMGGQLFRKRNSMLLMIGLYFHPKVTPCRPAGMVLPGIF